MQLKTFSDDYLRLWAAHRDQCSVLLFTGVYLQTVEIKSYTLKSGQEATVPSIKCFHVISGDRLSLKLMPDKFFSF